MGGALLEESASIFMIDDPEYLPAKKSNGKRDHCPNPAVKSSLVQRVPNIFFRDEEEGPQFCRGIFEEIKQQVLEFDESI